MRIFCDTNVITEFLEKRLQYGFVARILALPSDKYELHISEGGFYTITFLIDRQLRRLEIYNPERLAKERKALLRILATFHVACAGKEGLRCGVLDPNFKDLEDSYQYQAALNCKADALLTINIKDFKNVLDGPLPILTPEDFVAQYIDNSKE